jgi:hypothetical protein
MAETKRPALPNVEKRGRMVISISRPSLPNDSERADAETAET